MEQPFDPRPQIGHLGRELDRAGRRLTEPERDRGRAVTGVDDAHLAGRDLAYLPRVGTEQEDVSGHRLGGPVLVDRADERLVGLQHHPVVAEFGDGSTGRERCQPGAACGPAVRR